MSYQEVSFLMLSIMRSHADSWAVRPRLSQDRWLPQQRTIHLPGLNETMMYIHYPGSVRNGRKSRIPN